MGFLRELSKIPNVQKICVLVVPPFEVVKEQNANRERKVPEYALERMYRNFNMPHESEGWDKIEYHNTGEPVDLGEVIKMAEAFDQMNHHHTLTLGKHMLVTATRIDDFVDYIAANFHDIGKLYCQTFDDEGEAHYYNHHHIGAYVWLCSDLCYDWMHNDRYNSAWWIAQLICWHMTPYQYKSREEFVQWATRRGMPVDLIESIWTLHEADLEAH